MLYIISILQIVLAVSLSSLSSFWCIYQNIIYLSIPEALFLNPWFVLTIDLAWTFMQKLSSVDKWSESYRELKPW
jgi:hypothetical protein